MKIKSEVIHLQNIKKRSEIILFLNISLLKRKMISDE